jgi:hypothetical protein
MQSMQQIRWLKTFPKGEKVEHRKVTFTNRYGMSALMAT